MKILKNVAFTAATTIAVAPIITSCSFSKTVTLLNKIEVEMPQQEMELVEKTKLVSNPISIKCFDQNGNVMQATTKVVLTTQDDLTPPDWIWVDQFNQINVNAECSPSQYAFHLFVTDMDQKVKSEVKEFSVNILKAPLLPPDELEIEGIETTSLFYTQLGKVNLSPVVYKDEYPSKAISHDCYWSITNVDTQREFDLNLNPLFNLINTDHDCTLEISKDIDETYVGSYNITVQAISKLNPLAHDDINLHINIVNGFSQTDENTNYVYTRTSLDQEWTFSSVPKGTINIKNVLDNVFGIPVSKVADDFCSNNQITKLSACILPKSIRCIGENAFKNQSYFYSLAMPGVKCVDKSAFEGCRNVALLTTYEQPQLEVAYEKAFYGCTCFNLVSTNNFSRIDDMAFYGSGLTEINLGGCISMIGKECFSNCEHLENIIIPIANPPKLRGPLYSGSTHLKAIKVPQIGIENYKNDPTWSIYSDIIVGI